MTDQKHYLWLDLETTGLDPGRCAIIEIAAVLTTHTLDVLGEYETSVGVLGPAVWEAGALRMHAENGLIARWSSDLVNPDVAEIDGEMCSWINDLDVKRPILAGASVHFDRSFIQVHLPKLDDALHYRHLDVSAITEMMVSAGHTMPDAAPSEHRAMSDVRRTMALYEHWLSVAKQEPALGATAKLSDAARQIERLADHVRWRQFVSPAEISFRLRKLAQELNP